MVGEIVSAILAAIGTLAVQKGANKAGNFIDQKRDSKNQNVNSTSNKVEK